MEELNFSQSDSKSSAANYSHEDIVTLEGLAHVRHRPGMYIGKLGDGSSSDDGIYVLLKEVVDNSIDEFRMGCGKQIEITLSEEAVTVRDYGRGIPLEKLVDSVSVMNTSGKFSDGAFHQSVGLNGVGTKATNALSENFVAQSFREGKTRRAEFSKGVIVTDSGIVENTENEEDGTRIFFKPDPTLFTNYSYRIDTIRTMLRNYSYLNSGLTIKFNGERFYSKNGLKDLLSENMTAEPIYPIVHIKGEDIEIALTHCIQNGGDEYFSFVNGQYTKMGGTHQSAYREALGKAIKEFYAKNMELADIRNGLVGAIAINIVEPQFESQTKIKLGSTYMAPDKNSKGKPFPLSGVTVNKFVNDFVKKEIDDYLHKNGEMADVLLKKIQDAEKERKAIAGVTKQARERAKKVSLNNPKLRDCHVHLNDAKGDQKELSSIFITEGDSASGSITSSRDVKTQAVFSLRGKPLNSYGMTRKVVYENVEFNLLQAALNIEDGMEGLRYNRVIIATDADVDGMHIRLLLLTFFLQFFPDLVKKGHVYILQTPLFRVRDKKQTIYCYTEEERLAAIEKIGAKAEITRFKGLGEISKDEFKLFIGENIRLDQVSLKKEDAVSDLLRYYMGDNTPERQNFIIDNLVVEEDPVDEI
jgi:topoisomerase-4 subunit B